MRWRRWLLPLVSLMVVVPTLVALLFSGYGLFRQQKAMIAFSQAYALNLAEGLAAEASETNQRYGEGGRHRGHLQRMLTIGPPVPGWVAIVDYRGQVLQQSRPFPQDHNPELREAIASVFTSGVYKTLTLDDRRGRAPMAAAVYPTRDHQQAVIVAISWHPIPGPLMEALAYQPTISFIVSALALMGFFLMWRWCILPLRSLAGRIEVLHWGKDSLPQCPVGPLLELRELQQTISELAQSALERERLKRTYVADIVRTQEEERLRLAREIHDSALQSVAALIQRLQLSLRGLEKPQADLSRVRDHLEQAQNSAMAAVQEMRDVCDRLSPPWVGLGMARALEELTNRLSRIHGIEIALEISGDGLNDLPEGAVLSVCRIVQEAISNAVRHGKATSATVELKSDGRTMTLTVQDNGSGISQALDPEKLRVGGHRGVAGMTERAGLLKGSVTIGSLPQGGAEVRMTAPLVPQGA